MSRWIYRMRSKLKRLNAGAILLLTLVLWSTADVAWAVAPQGSESSSGNRVILKVDRQKVKAGSSIRLRLENLSMDEVQYSDPFALERYAEGRWLRLPRRKPFFSPLHGLAPGSNSPWQSAYIPVRSPTGTYRVSKTIRLDAGKFNRVATFQVH